MSTHYGSASLYTSGGSDLSNIIAKNGLNGFPIGLDKTQPTRGWTFNVEAMGGHLLTFGATRSGKGVSLIIPALLTYGGSVVVIDPKGENAWITAQRRRAMGLDTIILDPWDEVNRRYGQATGEREQTCRFNPFSHLDPSSLNFADDVASLADALIMVEGKEPHWSESARELLAGLIAYMVETDPQTATPRRLRSLLTLPLPELARELRIAIAGGPESVAARKLSRFEAKTTEIENIKSNAVTQTAFLDSPALCDAMDATEFDLSEIGTKRVSIYLVLPVNRLDTHGRWLRLLLTLIIGTIAALHNPPPSPVIFFVDEMGTIGRLNALARAYGLLAGMGVRVWGFLQDINQLSRDYNDGWQTFIANCDSIQVLTATDTNTAEYFSKMAGVRTVERISVATYEKRKGWLFFPGDPDYTAMADQLSQRPVLYPDEISRWPKDRLLLFPRGSFAIDAQRIIYYSDKRFAGHFRPLPEFAPNQPNPPLNKPFVGKITTHRDAAKALASLNWTITKPGFFGATWTITNRTGASQKIKKEEFIKVAKEMMAYNIRGD